MRRVSVYSTESIKLEAKYRQAIIKEAQSEEEKIMEYLRSKGRSKKALANKE